MFDIFKSGIWSEVASFLIVLATVRIIVNRVIQTINLHDEVKTLTTKIDLLEKQNEEKKRKLDQIQFMLKLILGEKGDTDE